MKSAGSVLLYAVVFAGQNALAADADSGKRLAQQHCSPCHIVEPNQRQDLADSPPFETIAQKYGNAPELIAYGHCRLYRHPGKIKRRTMPLRRCPRILPPISD